MTKFRRRTKIFERTVRDSRLELFEVSKTCDKKEKTIHQLNTELAKSENGVRNINQMYKEKVVDLNEKTAVFESEMEKVNFELEGLRTEKTEEMRVKDAQIFRLNEELTVLKKTHEKEVLGVRNDNEKTEINVCALQIKIKQLTEEQESFMYSVFGNRCIEMVSHGFFAFWQSF